jgi:FkbM family methyltransferase
VFYIKRWIPLTHPFPLKTFPRRLRVKWIFIVDNIFWPVKNKLGISSIKILGETPIGNTQLRLNKTIPLGAPGSVIELPRDTVIFRSVSRQGSWELEESEFLARGLKTVCQQSDSKAALLDIGANTGLVTLQAMNIAHTKNEVFLFEPVSRHAQAIKNNLRNLSNIHINEFALSDKNGSAEIFTEAWNHGNTSLIRDAVKSREKITTEIQLVDTAEYCETFLNGFDSYVIKCDTQGMDALILSRIPQRIWEKVECAVIEVWALPEVNEIDVKNLISMWNGFEYVSWAPNLDKNISLDEVSEFWLKKSGKEFGNLYLSKTSAAAARVLARSTRITIRNS